jgi:hypothetical protein
VGRFLRGRPSSVPTPVHLCVQSRPAPSTSSGRCQVGPDASRTPPVSLTSSRAGNRYAPNLLPRPLPFKPIPFLCYNTADHRRPNSCRWAIHPSPPHATRMPTCVPAALSHRVGCGAPWRPIATGRCSTQDAHARSSATKPHAAYPASRTDAVERASSRPRHSPAGTRA